MIKRQLLLIMLLANHLYSAEVAPQPLPDNQERLCYEKMLVDDPYSKTALRGVADCLYEHKKFSEAERYYQQLVLRPDLEVQESEEIYFNYGCSQAQMKKYKEALRSFEEVIKLHKDHERAKYNIEILKKLLEEQEQQDKQDQNKNQDQKDKDQQQGDDQQQDQENQQNDQQKNSQNKDQQQDQSKNDQSQDKKDQGKQEQGKDDRNKSEQEKEGNEQRDKNQQRRPDQQKSEQEREGESQDKKDRPEQQQGDNQEQQQHNQPSESKETSSEQKDKASGKKVQLDKQMTAILQQAGELEKEGQKLYMQALAGQKDNETEGDHDW